MSQNKEQNGSYAFEIIKLTHQGAGDYSVECWDSYGLLIQIYFSTLNAGNSETELYNVMIGPNDEKAHRDITRNLLRVINEDEKLGQGITAIYGENLPIKGVCPECQRDGKTKGQTWCEGCMSTLMAMNLKEQLAKENEYLAKKGEE